MSSQRQSFESAEVSLTEAELQAPPDLAVRNATDKALSVFGFLGGLGSVIAMIIAPPNAPNPWLLLSTTAATTFFASLTVLTGWRARGEVQPRLSLRTFAVLATALLGHISIAQTVPIRDDSQVLVSVFLQNSWAAAMLPWRLSLVVVAIGAVTPTLGGAEYILSFGRAPPGTINGLIMLLAAAFPMVISISLGSMLGTMRRNFLQRQARFKWIQNSLESVIEQRSAALLESQEQFFRAQRLRSVGTLAAGLAHELNNILTPARGFAEIIASGSAPERDQSYARRILDATVASTAIIRALLTYTKQVPFQPEPTNLRNFINGQVLPILSQLTPDNIRLRIECPRDIKLIVDRQMLQQCLTNLVLNAIDAIEGKGEGKPKGERNIEIIASIVSQDYPGRVSPTADGDEESGTLRDGIHAQIQVRDDGPGISAAEIDEVFDPFFTTKDHGTGLGLAAVQGITERHGGNISVASGREGTTFTLTFPALPSPPNAEETDGDNMVGDDVLRALVLTEDEDLADELEAMLSEFTFTMHDSPSYSAELDAEIESGRFDIIFEDVDRAPHQPRAEQRKVLVPRVLLSRAPIDDALLRTHSAGLTVGLRKPVDPLHLNAIVSRALSTSP